MSNNDHIVTFGVEMETCIVFTEEILRSILQLYNIPYEAIVKGHPTQLNERFDDRQLLTRAAMNAQRIHYPSWTLARSGGEEEDPFNYTFVSRRPFSRENPEDSTRTQWIRKLFVEHLLIAKTRFNWVEMPANVIGSIHSTAQAAPLPVTTSCVASDNDSLVSPSANYSKWTLTNDTSLTGLLRSQILNSVPWVDESNIDNVGSEGMEIISPIFTFEARDEAFSALKTMLTSLCSGQRTCVVPTVWAGLHVHVGLNTIGDPDQRELINESFVRHLLYILLLHQQLITECFPRSRSAEEVPETPPPPAASPEGPDFDSMTDDQIAEFYAAGDAAEAAEAERQANLTLEQKIAEHAATEQQAIRKNEEMVLAAEKQRTNKENLGSNLDCFLETLQLTEAYRTHPTSHSLLYSVIFDPNRFFVRQLLESFQKPTTARSNGAAELSRGYFYNFSNLYTHMYIDPAQKPTVEFRQHEACVDAKKIACWVRFLEALTKKASELAKVALERKGEQVGGAAAAAGEFPPDAEFPFGVISDLCRWIGLEEGDIGYWCDRWVEHNMDRPSAEEGDLF